MKCRRFTFTVRNASFYVCTEYACIRQKILHLPGISGTDALMIDHRTLNILIIGSVQYIICILYDELIGKKYFLILTHPFIQHGEISVCFLINQYLLPLNPLQINVYDKLNEFNSRILSAIYFASSIEPEKFRMISYDCLVCERHSIHL